MLGLNTIIWIICIAWTTGVFWLLSPAKRFPFLLAVGAGVLVWFDWRSAVIVAVMTATTYATVTNIQKHSAVAAGGIGVIAAILVAFKLVSAPLGGSDVTDLVIPLGLSYYALRAIHVILESYKGRLATLAPVDLLSYLIFVPTLVTGPIHRFPQFERDKRRHRWDEAMFVEGIDRLLHGFFKIIIVYNILVLYITAAVMDQIGAEQEQLRLYATMVSVGIGLYVQFSGYSDIAIGFARLLGIRVMENFDYPYFKPNISAFWRSWHISLTSWSREYVYGSVVAITRSPALGAIAALVFVGIWHEASLRYLIWGAYHGLGIVAWQYFQTIKPKALSPDNALASAVLHGASVMLTLHFVWLGFLLVRQPGPAEMWGTFVTLVMGS